MASLVLVIVLCLLLISGGCSDSSNDGGSGGNIYAGKLVNAESRERILRRPCGEKQFQAVHLGLSQGGQVTMAVQKYLESANSEQPFNLTASTPIAGIYDVPKEWDFLFTNPHGCSPLGAVNIEVVDVGSGYSHAESFAPSVIRAKFWFDTF